MAQIHWRVFIQGARWTSFAGLLLLPGALAGATDLSETSVGDLSGNRLVPTAWSLGFGSNHLSATTGRGSADREFVTLNVPFAMQLSRVVLDAYTGSDGTGFIGIVTGTQMTVDPANPNVALLLGYTHFGTNINSLGDDILPSIGTGPGSQEFTPPLASGDYSLWIQQIGSPMTYTLNFRTSAVLKGDANFDGAVGAGDYAIWAAQFGQSSADLASDFDGSGSVGSADYALWAANFGATIPGAGESVPEPATCVLATLGGLSLFALRHLAARRFRL